MTKTIFESEIRAGLNKKALTANPTVLPHQLGILYIAIYGAALKADGFSKLEILIDDGYDFKAYINIADPSKNIY